MHRRLLHSLPRLDASVENMTAFRVNLSVFQYAGELDI